MSASIQLNSSQSLPAQKVVSPSLSKKKIAIALSVIMTLGMIFSYVMGAPWVIPLTFFALALGSLFPVGMGDDRLLYLI
jgi:hypothetical protein